MHSYFFYCACVWLSLTLNPHSTRVKGRMSVSQTKDSAEKNKEEVLTTLKTTSAEPVDEGSHFKKVDLLRVVSTSEFLMCVAL